MRCRHVLNIQSTDERQKVENGMTIVCVGLMLMLLAFSDAAMASALTAARCFASGVMPALLPMMVVGKFLPNDTKPEHSHWRQWFWTVFYAFAAGSPAAAQRAAGKRHAMNSRSWECLLCLTGVMSPMFFTGTLAGWLGSARDGWLLLGIHWLGAAITAGFWRLGAKKVPAEPMNSEIKPQNRITLPEAIAQSAHSLLCVCGAMMVFSIAACLLKSLLTWMFPVWTAEHAHWLAAVWAVMEIGGGSSAVIGTIERPHALLSALCGFGGLSIWLQNMLFLDENIRPAKLLAMRAVHGAVCYALVKVINPF